MLLGEVTVHWCFYVFSLCVEMMILRIGVFSHFLCTRKESDKESALKLFLLLGRKSFRIKKKKLHASPVRVQRTGGSAVWLGKSKRERNLKRA
ncbi:MAG: hypothetical protein E7630_03135 [Ruminococcaceae bacterium]|nr:hypothetical protein [Oscillospiraceae bacterium]